MESLTRRPVQVEAPPPVSTEQLADLPSGSMSSLSLGTPRTVTVGSDSRLALSITFREAMHEVWYRVSEGALADGSETCLAALLLPAMTLGRPLRIPGRISPRLVGRIERIQDIFVKWCPDLKKIALEVDLRGEQADREYGNVRRGVACFFSGGVDSFYTFVKHREEISHLIFLRGFDIPLENKPLLQIVTDAVRQIAEELERPLVEVETNVRSFSDPCVSWTFYHGALLASIALLLAPRFRTVYIPSSHSYAQLFPWGSHPLLDPLWSTEETEIVHDGCEASRVEKLESLTSCDVATKHLRVCWENRNGAYNCGLCEKCIRTMVTLRIVGLLDRSPSFARPLDLNAVARLDLPDENARTFIEENLHALETMGKDDELARVLRKCLENRHGCAPRQQTHYLLDKALDGLKAVGLAPVGRRVLKALSL
jgi:hypothetical protein